MANTNTATSRNLPEPDEKDKTGDQVSGTVSWLKGSLAWLVGSKSPGEKKLRKHPAVTETELEVVSEGDWVVLETSLGEFVDMSSSAAAAASSSVSGANGGSSRQQHQDGSTSSLPVSYRKRTTTSNTKPHTSTERTTSSNTKPHTSTTPLGPRTNSVSTKSHVKSTGLSTSHAGSTNTSMQRKVGGKTTSSKPVSLEVQSGGGSAGGGTRRCASPSVYQSSSLKTGEGKGRGVGGETKGTTPRVSSPSSSTSQSIANGSSASPGSAARSSKKKGILVSNNTDSSTPSLANHSTASPHPASNGSTNGPQQTSHGNGNVVPPISITAAPKENGTALVEKSEGAGSSAFEKVRDTLRINRPKKKKKGKKLAYSIVVDPARISTPEIHLQSGRYQDPFETSFAENGEPEKKVYHDFKPASIPHNKPEYCDHCGDMAWGLYRQVLKCSSESVYGCVLFVVT